MRITGSQVYYGPNVMTDAPVIKLQLDMGAAQGWTTDRLTSLVDQVATLLPGIAADPGETDKPGGLVAQMRMPPGQPLSRLVARVALELQRMDNADVHVWGDFPTSEPSVRHPIFAYEDVDTGLSAGQAAVAIIEATLPANLRPSIGQQQADPAGLRDLFLGWARHRELDQTTRALVNAARRRGIPWFRIGKHARFIQLGHGHRQQRLHETLTGDVPSIATHLVRDKLITNELLRESGLPVPRQHMATDAEAAVRGAESIGYPVAVKPASGRKGQGISLRLFTADAVRLAFAEAAKHGPVVIVESFIPGDDHRLLVVDGKLVAAARRIPGHVAGDGQTSIAALVDALNRDPRRGADYDKLMNRIEWDAQAEALLQERGYSRDSVPTQGEVVFLRRTANISTGGTAIDVLDEIHPDNRRMAERAARLCGLPVAGVDFLTPDISRSYLDVPSAICELNVSPGLRPHWIANPHQDVVGPILDHLFPDGTYGRIPIAAITGTNGKTTTAVMLSHILTHAGRVVGRATSDSAWVDDDRVVRGEVAGVNGARVILRDPRVEVAVLEVARKGLLDRGIGFDRCTVAAVTNIDDDHLGTLGIDSLEDMARVKQVVARLARDTVVLNGDDPLCRTMAENCQAEHVCLITLQPKQAGLADHLMNGGRAVWLDDAGQIQLHDGSGIRHLLAARDIPATLDGIAIHNIANAMFAAGMASALDISSDDIRAALVTFDCTPETNPGRLNIYDGHPFRVIVDYAHNPPGVARIRRLVEQMHPDGRRILSFYTHGNRTDDQIKRLAQAAAGGFDQYLCCQPQDLRGRPPGEVTGLQRTTLIDAGVPPEAVSEWTSQSEAIAHALDLAAPEDVVVLLCDDYIGAWEQVTTYKSAHTAGQAECD